VGCQIQYGSDGFSVSLCLPIAQRTAQGTGQCNQHFDLPAGWKIKDLNPITSRRFLSSPLRPDQLWSHLAPSYLVGNGIKVVRM